MPPHRLLELDLVGVAALRPLGQLLGDLVAETFEASEDGLGEKVVAIDDALTTESSREAGGHGSGSLVSRRAGRRGSNYGPAGGRGKGFPLRSSASPSRVSGGTSSP